MKPAITGKKLKPSGMPHTEFGFDILAGGAELLLLLLDNQLRERKSEI